MELKQLLLVDRNLAKWKKEGNDLYQKIKGYIKHYEELDSKWNSILTEVASWRKANQIHHWFVENAQNGIDDCISYEVKRHHAVVLYNNCEIVRRLRS